MLAVVYWGLLIKVFVARLFALRADSVNLNGGNWLMD